MLINVSTAQVDGRAVRLPEGDVPRTERTGPADVGRIARLVAVGGAHEATMAADLSLDLLIIQIVHIDPPCCWPPRVHRRNGEKHPLGVKGALENTGILRRCRQPGRALSGGGGMMRS